MWGRPDNRAAKYLATNRCLQPVSRRLQLPPRRLQPVSAAYRHGSCIEQSKQPLLIAINLAYVITAQNTSNFQFLKSIIFKSALGIVLHSSGRHEWRHLFYKGIKECSKKFAVTFKGKLVARRNVLRIFLLFLEDFGAPL